MSKNYIKNLFQKSEVVMIGMLVTYWVIIFGAIMYVINQVSSNN